MATESLAMRDDFGDTIEVTVSDVLTEAPDGSISPAGAVLVTFNDGDESIIMRLSRWRLDQFRELLDRAAMPGQPPAAEARACPHCKHCRSTPCQPHEFPCVDGCNDREEASRG